METKVDATLFIDQEEEFHNCISREWKMLPVVKN